MKRYVYFFAALAAVTAQPASAISLSSTDFTMTKTLPDTPGNASVTSATNQIGFAFGEAVAGQVYKSTTFQLNPGYYAGFFGNGGTFTLISSHVGAAGTSPMMQLGLQIGVPLNAPVTLTFSDVVSAASAGGGITAEILTDHLGQSTNPPGSSAFVPSTDASGKQLILTPQGAWKGNTLYDIVLTPDFSSVDGFGLDRTYHVQFLTVLDPSVDNVVIHPNFVQAAAASAEGLVPGAQMSLSLPAQALSSYSIIVFNPDPIHAPIQANPSIIAEANAKAISAGGPYRAPIAYEEIVAYDLQGRITNQLANAGSLSVSYSAPNGFVSGAPLVRARTLSLWVLDTTHQLWVKMGSTRNSVSAADLNSPTSRLTLFALMGEADPSTEDVSVFPVPWRPHGPKAGTGPGQTGTESSGITFTNLPSEARIRIFTLAGELVRDIHHSDTGGLIGQETWDGKTGSGNTVASGTYLWRVESATDGKNGKLMIIR